SGKSRKVAVEPIEGAIADYLESFRAAKRAADFVVVNVSSPNTKDLRAMQGAELARLLLAAITRENSLSTRVPLLVKIAPDLSDADLEALLAVVDECGLDGVVATNTTLARANLATAARDVEAVGAGGLSGPPLRMRALEVIRRVRMRLGAKAAVIGVGGVETSDHLLDLLRAGADLVQMYTGFIYGGPGTPRRILRDILTQIDRAGAASLRELVDGNTQIGDAPGPFR
ncbi:MAG: dihydroorotate dehydrogenase (quinone), partial [Polyangiaceae bacterium]